MQIPALIGLTLSIYVLIEPSEKASLGLLIVYILLIVAYIIGGCFKVCFFLLYSYSDVEDYGGIGVIFLIYLSIIVAMSLGMAYKCWLQCISAISIDLHRTLAYSV